LHCRHRKQNKNTNTHAEELNLENTKFVHTKVKKKKDIRKTEKRETKNSS